MRAADAENGEAAERGSGRSCPRTRPACATAEPIPCADFVDRQAACGNSMAWMGERRSRGVQSRPESPRLLSRRHAVGLEEAPRNGNRAELPVPARTERDPSSACGCLGRLPPQVCRTARTAGENAGPPAAAHGEPVDCGAAASKRMILLSTSKADLVSERSEKPDAKSKKAKVVSEEDGRQTRRTPRVGASSARINAAVLAAPYTRVDETARGAALSLFPGSANTGHEQRQGA